MAKHIKTIRVNAFPLLSLSLPLSPSKFTLDSQANVQADPNRDADDQDEENVIQRTALDLGGRKATDTIEVYGVSREELTAPRTSLSLRI